MGMVTAFPPRSVASSVRGLIVLWIALLPISCAVAQSTEERLAEAERALQTGQYDEARTAYRSLYDELAGDRPDLALDLFSTYLAVGDFGDGLVEVERLLAAAPGDPYLGHLRGRFLDETGRYEEAARAYQDVYERRPEFWRNTLALADLLHTIGRKRPAAMLYEQIYTPYRSGALRTAAALAVAGRAAARLEQFREANQAFRTAYDLDPERVETLQWWGDLFAEKFNSADAQRTYEEGLALNPSHAGLLLGMARTSNAFQRQEDFARRALAVNPNAVEALARLAELSILDAQYQAAETLARRALDVNPASLDALAQLASVQLLRRDSTAFARTEARALEVRSNAGAFYQKVAENLALRFRYPDAAQMARRAVAVEGDNPRVYATLGVALFRLGDVREARRYLEAAFGRDPYDLYTRNTLELLDEFENFERLESDHFELWIHRDESDVLGARILQAAEEGFAALGARYPYRPEGKIRLEAYNDHDDLGVRVAGLPHLGLLGVCFGDVLAIETPRAQQAGSYNWARTLRHELAHTMAIGVADFRVPRWFTEGLSVYEEKRARPDWARELDLEFFAAFDQDRLLPLSDIDRGFTRPAFPGQVMLSYFHASRVIEYIVDRYGFDAVVATLENLAADLAIEQALELATGASVDELDAGFRSALGAERARLASVLDGLPDLGAAAEASESDPSAGPVIDTGESPFFDALRRGQNALAAGRLDEAEEQFERAIDLYPAWTHAGNPYLALAELYAARGNADARIAVLERYLRYAEHGAEAARELGAHYAARDDLERARAYFERSIEVDPYDPDAWSELARLYAQSGRHDEAVYAWRAVIGLDPVDRATAQYELARSLHAAGRKTAARRALLEALEQAPGFRDAQRLLLEWVDGGA